MTACCKVKHPEMKPPDTDSLCLVCELMALTRVLSTDPGKYSYTPRLFRLSASSGVFEGEERLYPARVTDDIMAMPFLQENLYNTQQPGTSHR